MNSKIRKDCWVILVAERTMILNTIGTFSLVNENLLKTYVPMCFNSEKEAYQYIKDKKIKDAIVERMSIQIDNYGYKKVRR